MTTMIMGIIALALAIVFAIFVVAMACDQYEGIVTNTTGALSLHAWLALRRATTVGEGRDAPCSRMELVAAKLTSLSH